MGLDSYLYANKYVSGYDFSEEKEVYFSLLKMLGIEKGEIQSHAPSGSIRLTVGYWRKANSIHSWFVRECQKGVDDCGSYYVSREQLEKLREICKEVIKTKNTSLLETKNGFFFGSTDYNEYYYRDLEDTVSQLNMVLDNPKFNDWNFEYHASW